MIDETPPSAAIADVLLMHGERGVLSPPLRLVTGPSAPVLGAACTVAFAETEHGEGGAFEELYTVLDGDLEGRVLVLGGAEAVTGAIWGQILSLAAERAGALAVLIGGAVRDLAELQESPVAVWAISEHTMGATGSARVIGIDVPVTIGGSPIEPGDTIVADAGGVVRVARADASRLLEEARAYSEAEQRLMQEVADGVPLSKAYEHKRVVRRRIIDR